MKLIPLSKGQFAKVDDHRYDFLMRWKWFAAWHKQTQGYYACRNQNVAAPGEKWKNTQVRMHREILGLKRGDSRQGEHINGDSLDNQDDNLRIATNSQNAMNRRRIVANNTSGHKGVYFRKDKKNKPWYVFIKINQKIMGITYLIP